MIEIHDLDRARELSVGDVPDPYGPVGDDDFLAGSGPAASPGFAVNAAAELFGRLDSPRAGSGTLVAHWPALPISCGLREHAAQLDFPRVRRFVAVPAFAVLGLDRRHRHARTIHFDIKHRDLAARDIGQIELNGALDVCLLAARDITAYGFGMPFDG
jgi:hypothetical protein